MKKALRILSVFAVVATIAAGSAAAFQAIPSKGAGSTGGHTLYGDLKIDTKSSTGNVPLSFVVILYNVNGLPFGRVTLANGGRYRFQSVPNGDWELAVEAEGVEQARIHLLLNEKRFTDIRKDLTLEWRDTPTQPAAMTYNRSEANSQRWDKAASANAKKDYKQAVSLLKEIVADDPKDSEAWVELGTTYFRQGNRGEAEKAYRRATEVQPEYVLGWLNLGKVLIDGKNFPKAVEALDRAVELKPDLADSQYYLGVSLLQVKKGSQAVVHLNEAIRLDPIGMADAHLRLASLYHAAGYRDRAAAEYERFLAKKPDYPEKEKLEKYIRENKKP